MTRRTKTQREAPLDWNAARSAQRYSSLRDLSVTYEGHSDTIATRLPDISSRGMFINTARHFPEGTVLNVRFRLARTGVRVQCRCEVRYCLEGVGVGVEFVDISADAAQAIERELSPAEHQRGNHTRLPHRAAQSRNGSAGGGKKKTRKAGRKRRKK